MKLRDWLKVQKALWIVARWHGCGVLQARWAIQQALDDAWGRAWQPGNIKGQVAWQRLFPGGRKPSVEQFIIGTTQKPTSGNNPYSLF